MKTITKPTSKRSLTVRSRYTAEQRSGFAKKSWRTIRRKRKLDKLQEHFTKDESRYHVLHAQDEVLEGVDMRKTRYRMATLPCSQLRFEKLLLQRHPRTDIVGAEIDPRTYDLAWGNLKKLVNKTPGSDISFCRASFADVVRSNPMGFHSIWFDCCSPLRAGGFNQANPGELDPANSIDAMFSNKHLFKPAFDLGIPGQMFITVLNKRDNVKYLASLSRDHGFEWKPEGKGSKAFLANRRHNRYARIAATIQKVQVAAARVGLLAIPCMALLYSGAKGEQNRCSPMSVVGLNIYRPKNERQRKQMLEDIEACKGKILESTIVIGD